MTRSDVSYEDGEGKSWPVRNDGQGHLRSLPWICAGRAIHARTGSWLPPRRDTHVEGHPIRHRPIQREWRFRKGHREIGR